MNRVGTHTTFEKEEHGDIIIPSWSESFKCNNVGE
jgi:hypothetical protein